MADGNIVVLGFEGSGKTCFVNSLLMYLRSDVLTPSISTGHTDQVGVYRYNDGEFDLRIIDTPPVVMDNTDLASVTKLLTGELTHRMTVSDLDADEPSSKGRLYCDLAIVIVKYNACNLADLEKFVGKVRSAKRPYIVVVTHRDMADLEKGHFKQFVEDVAKSSKTSNAVVCITNFVQGPRYGPKGAYDSEQLPQDSEETFDAIKYILTMAKRFIAYDLEAERYDLEYETNNRYDESKDDDLSEDSYVTDYN